MNSQEQSAPAPATKVADFVLSVSEFLFLSVVWLVLMVFEVWLAYLVPAWFCARGLRMMVRHEAREPSADACSQCSYSMESLLQGLTGVLRQSVICPECGTRYLPLHLRPTRVRLNLGSWRAAGGALLVVCGVLLTHATNRSM